MSENQYIELLSPARNLECGLAAINYGADAVYIGGPSFGARESAGNPVRDIEKLVRHAHLYGAKAFVALNTILYDHELKQAEDLIHQIYQAGADALIVQDMGILEMDLPPIALHASTQTNNYHPEKIKFLEKVGFERVVLARELSLEQIKAIRQQTNVELEAFVHGALCVSLSGQCYLSQAIGGRSANRGACAQPCRQSYTLTDKNGKVLSRDKHLLSLKDLNLSASVDQLARAGVCSLKIEGRLKDVEYVKNITAYYRQQIDGFLEKNTDFRAASEGKVHFGFTPDPHKSFSRGATDYFLNERHKGIANFDSPKSLGEKIGKVDQVKERHFTVRGSAELHNNDGLVFISRGGDSIGIKVNRVEGKQVFPMKMNGIFPGAILYRNFDHQFVKLLQSNPTTRKIRTGINLSYGEDQVLHGTIADESGLKVHHSIHTPADAARDIEKSEAQIIRQLSKSGNTPFSVEKVNAGNVRNYFFPASILNTLRRELLEKLKGKRETRKPVDRIFEKNEFPYPEETISYLGNVSNQLAKQFYQRHGISQVEQAFELRKDYSGKQVMITRHCIKYELGHCLIHQKQDNSAQIPPIPWYLSLGNRKLKLEFDCKNCMMKVIFVSEK